MARGRDRQRRMTRMTGARHNIKLYQLVDLAERTINVTDPDARNLRTPRGWVQGYNAQAVVTREQIIAAAEISTDSLARDHSGHPLSALYGDGPYRLSARTTKPTAPPRLRDTL